MSAIGPGDWVECLQTCPREPGEKSGGFRVGGIYCVRVVVYFPDGPGLLFTDMPDPCELWGGSDSWDGQYFRPIYRPKAEFIESLMQPAPELEPA